MAKPNDVDDCLVVVVVFFYNIDIHICDVIWLYKCLGTYICILYSFVCLSVCLLVVIIVLVYRSVNAASCTAYCVDSRCCNDIIKYIKIEWMNERERVTRG